MKTSKLKALFIFLFIFPTLSSFADKNHIFNKEIITTNSITKDVEFLASDALKGRGNFTPELQQAANYLAKRFHQLNIKPWPNNLTSSQQNTENLNNPLSTYFQTFKLSKQQEQKLRARNKSFNASLAKPKENTLKNTTLRNVIAYIPGKTKPEEIILFSAHYDHIGLKQTDFEKLNNSAQQDLIFNGADDNASGVAAVLQLAQYYKAYYQHKDNARTIMFIAFAGEELGGFGSQYFSKSLKPENIVAMINIEMIGKTSSFGEGKFWLTGFNYSNLGTLLNQYIAEKNEKNNQNNWQIYPDPYPKYNLFYRSDNATLARLGVPAHTISASQIDKDQHYHQVSDHATTLNIISMQKLIQNLSLAGTGLIDGKITPTRIHPKNLK